MNTAQVAEEICQALLKDGVMLKIDGQGHKRHVILPTVYGGDTVEGHMLEATLQQRESIDIVQAILEAHLR